MTDLVKFIDSEAKRYGELITRKDIEVAKFMNQAHQALVLEPKLNLCTPASLHTALVNCSVLGILPGRVMGHAYLVPRRRQGVWEVQLMVSYQGMIHLCTRDGHMQRVYAAEVMANDSLKINLGEGTVDHQPCTSGPRGDPYAVWVRGVYPDGAGDVHYADYEEIEAFRRKCDTGPVWAKFFAEMAKKTLVKRAAKYWPRSLEMSSVIAMEEHADRGERLDLSTGSVVDAVFSEPAPEADVRSLIEVANTVDGLEALVPRLKSLPTAKRDLLRPLFMAKRVALRASPSESTTNDPMQRLKAALDTESVDGSAAPEARAREVSVPSRDSDT